MRNRVVKKMHRNESITFSRVLKKVLNSKAIMLTMNSTTKAALENNRI